MPELPSEYDALGSESTLLKMTVLGLPPYAARGITQTLSWIDGAANLQRTINGELVDFSFDQFRKYQSTLSASDQRPPASDNVWPGAEVIVECIKELAYLTAGGTPQRPVAEGSSRVEGDYTFYRPVLIMMVKSIEMTADEWAAGEEWSISLEEI